MDEDGGVQAVGQAVLEKAGHVRAEEALLE